MNTHPNDTPRNGTARTGMARTGTPPHDATSRDERFDAAMRGLHRSALANLSPQVRWRLKPAGRQPRGGVAGWFFGRWPSGPLVAGAGVAALAIALGLAVWPAVDPGTQADPAPAIATADDSAGVLEQDPDFYAWLVSDDAALVAME